MHLCSATVVQLCIAPGVYLPELHVDIGDEYWVDYDNIQPIHFLMHDTGVLHLSQCIMIVDREDFVNVGYLPMEFLKIRTDG